MKHKTLAADAAAAVPPGTARPGAKTFVLVHGGFHGGWCWSRVATLLRARGHAVFTPTQTGCGERSHLLSRSITLDTFVDDIANVLKFEDLGDVVLVGHSFGGNSISGVADRMPERLRRLVYLDALVLEPGQSVFGLLPKDVVEARMQAAEASGGLSIAPMPPSAFGIVDAEQAAFVQARLTPHPLGTYVSPLKLDHPLTNGVPAVFVRCTAPAFPSVGSSYERARAHGMRTVDIATGHDAMVIAPALLADVLDEVGGA